VPNRVIIVNKFAAIPLSAKAPQSGATEESLPITTNSVEIHHLAPFIYHLSFIIQHSAFVSSLQVGGKWAY
jgi:hypothetical protein